MIERTELPLISIVVPIYNGEMYLDDCVYSLLNQTYSNVEIVLVNDGSTDKSGCICEKYANADARVKYVKQINSGAAVSRKIGISVSTGKFVGFVDADDYVDLDMYENLFNMIGDADMVTSGHYKKYENVQEEIAIFDNIEEGSFSDNVQMEYLWSNMIYVGENKEHKAGVLRGLCNKLFRTDLMKRVAVTYDSNIKYGEDSILLYKYLLECESVIVSHKCFYHYRMNMMSASNTVDRWFLKNINEFYVTLLDVFSTHYMEDNLTGQLEERVKELVNQGLNYKLGFKSVTKELTYIMKEPQKFYGKKVVVYGAGRVGRDVYSQLNQICDVVGWVDRNYNGFRNELIQSVDYLEYFDYDYIYVALKDKSVIKAIIADLLGRGIMKDKIVYELF